MFKENQEVTKQPREEVVDKHDGVKKEKPFIDLAEFGIEEGKDIKLEQIAEIFEKRPDLVDGLRRNCYWEIQNSLMFDYDQQHSLSPLGHQYDTGGGIWRFVENTFGPPRWEKTDWKSERKTIIGEDDQGRYVAEVNFDINEEVASYRRTGREVSTRLSLIFSVDKETARKYWEEFGKEVFYSPDDFKFHGIFINQGHGRRRIFLKEAAKKRDEILGSTRIDFDKIKKMIDDMKPIPEIRCPEAESKIRDLAEKHEVENKEIEKLIQAVRDFRTFYKDEPKTREECFREIGRCFTVPRRFEDLCRKKFGLDVSEDFYEEGYGQGRGYIPVFYHSVDIFGGFMVIDWTARQYREFDNELYPFVYEVGDSKIPKHWGELVKTVRWKKEKNK